LEQETDKDIIRKVGSKIFSGLILGRSIPSIYHRMVYRQTLLESLGGALNPAKTCWLF